MELYKAFRPKRLADVIGQKEAIQVITSKLKNGFPHACLFSGPSGTGKTTVARILRKKLECSPRDFYEINAADKSGINDVRLMKTRMHQSPGPDSKCKIYLLDEAERMTPDAQGAMLKMLEDTPNHVHFILCTTNPQKLRNEIHTRCMHVKFKAVGAKDMQNLLNNVCLAEALKVKLPVTDKIVQVANGSPRKALVLLDQVKDLDNEDDMLEAVEKSDLAAQGFSIAQALIYKKPWREVAKLIDKVEEEPETVRRIILGYASKVLLGGGKFSGRAYLVLEAFRENFYDSGKSGLVCACFEVCHAK